MATVNMSNVNFYNPDTVLNPPYKKTLVSTLNMHRRPLQPINSQASAFRNDRDDDSSDDSLPSLDDLLRPSQNKDIPQMPPQNYDPLHRSEKELIDESGLLTDPTTLNSVYVLGSTQGRFLSSLLYLYTLY